MSAFGFAARLAALLRGFAVDRRGATAVEAAFTIPLLMSQGRQASIGDALIFMTKAALGICLIAAGAWIYVVQTQGASKQAVDDAYL
jgi:Flp pilus assembly protein TadG